MAFDLDTLGITDEAVAVRAPTDYFIIAPHDQTLTYGVDGLFATGSPWMLQSATGGFVDSGMVQGSMMELILIRPGLTSQATTYNKNGRAEQFAVETVTTGQVSLRRVGQAVGKGFPPGNLPTTAIQFVCLTVMPQVRYQVAEVLRTYRIGSTADLNMPDDFTNLVIWNVLADLYFAHARICTDATKDGFYSKAQSCLTKSKSLMATLDGRYNTNPESGGLVTAILPGRARRACDEVGGYPWRW